MNRLRSVAVVELVWMRLIVRIMRPGCDAVVVRLLLVQVTVDALWRTVEGRRKFAPEGMEAIDVGDES